MRLFTLFLFIAFPLQAHAASFEEVFRDGVFGTKWNTSLNEVKKIYPDGDIKEIAGLIAYEIKDGRPLFGLDRGKRDYIMFQFDASNQLNGVSIEFSSEFAKVQSAISSSLGQNPMPLQNSFVPASKWSDGSGIDLTLMFITGAFSQYVVLSITKKPKPTNVNKEHLGF